MKNYGIPSGWLFIIFVKKYHNYSIFTFHHSWFIRDCCILQQSLFRPLWTFLFHQDDGVEEQGGDGEDGGTETDSGDGVIHRRPVGLLYQPGQFPNLEIQGQSPGGETHPTAKNLVPPAEQIQHRQTPGRQPQENTQQVIHKDAPLSGNIIPFSRYCNKGKTENFTIS